MKFYIGKQLATKDGRRIGNVIIVNKETYQKTNYWVVCTDYGRIITLLEDELKTFFHVDFKCQHEKDDNQIADWLSHRLNSIDIKEGI